MSPPAPRTQTCVALPAGGSSTAVLMSSRYPSTLCRRVGSGLGCACGGHPGRRLGAAPRAGPLRQRHLDLPWKSVRISKIEIRCRGGHLWACTCGVGIRGRTGRYPGRL